jgi:LacI family transcriptional regulator, repressor for deo operon, udp, cdd, tsx, nupC, and nupG
VRVRLADVAVEAGVSEATVSRVLNDRPGVSDRARQAVVRALDLLGHERPAALRQAGTRLVGLVLPELDNPVFPAFASAAARELTARRCTPLLCSHIPGGVHEDSYLDALLARGVAGLMFICGINALADTDPGRYVALRRRGIPLVLVDGPQPAVDAPAVTNDDAAAVDLAVAHLADLGHTRIGLVAGPRRYTTVTRRLRAFPAALRRHVGNIGAADAEDLVASALFTVEGGASAADTLLDRGVTALACGSDVMALGAIAAVRRRGLRVPEDVSVVGSDDSPVLAFTHPPLTTVHQPVEAMMQAAVRMLVDEMEGNPAARAEHIFAPRLVVRGSTAPPSEAAAAASDAVPATAAIPSPSGSRGRRVPETRPSHRPARL